ncbi:hypothetical protein ABPG74_000249 [Tetrahymena malaccensis]
MSQQVKDQQIGNQQEGIYKMPSINNSNVELIFNEQNSSDPKTGSSLRFGDNKRRLLLDENSSPMQPKVDIQQEIINNPSNNSFFQTHKVLKKLDDSPKKIQLQAINSVNFQLSPSLQNSNLKNSPEPDKISHLQSQLNNEVGLKQKFNVSFQSSSKPKISLQVSLMAKRFAQKFKLKSSSVMFQKLTQKQLKMIGDLSFSIRHHKQVMQTEINKCSYLFIQLKNILTTFIRSESFVFDPNSSFQIIWSIWTFIYTILLLIIVPVKFCMGVNILYYYDVIIDVSIIFMVFNILIQMNQAIYKRGILIKKRMQIIKNYLLKDKFWIDFFILSSYLASLSSSDNQFLQLPIILKLGYVLDMYDKIMNMLEIKQKYKHYGIFLKIFFQILLIAHLTGCFFIKIALGNQDQNNWISRLKIPYNDYTSIYSSAIYWSVITMLTVGYGDITPVSIDEKIYVIFVSLVSCGIFGYSLNTIGYILKTKQDNKAQFQNKINDLSHFMKKRQVNRDLRDKVFKYFHYVHKEQIYESSKVYSMINELPEKIFNNFQVELYQKMLREHPFFKSTFSESFIQKICQSVKEMRIGPDMNLNEIEKLNQAYTIPLHQKVYFVMKGQISCQTGIQKDRIIKTYEKGECFGLPEFISGQTLGINSIYRTKSVVILAFIDKSEFLQLLEQFPPDKENFFMIKDKISYNNQFELNKQRCLACSNENHSVQFCDRLHLKPNFDKLLYEYNSSKKQERRPIVRKNLKRYNQYACINYEMDSDNQEQFDQVRNEYITQYTSHKIPTDNKQVTMYQGNRHHSYSSNVSFQLKDHSKQTTRINKRKKTNQSVAIREGSQDNRKPPIVKIKEFKAQNSLGNSANDFDLISLQNRSKRSHSELQFQPDQLGSHQMIAYLSPRNGNNQPQSSNNNQLSMTNLAVSNNIQSNPHTSSNFINPSGFSVGQSGIESSQHPQQSIKEMNIRGNDIYFNKEDQQDGSLYKDEDIQINQSFNSLYKKRNNQKKQSKKLKGSAAVFNMDEIKIKKTGNGIITLSNKQLSQTYLPEVQQTNQEDQLTSSINTYNQINSHTNIQSQTNIQNQFASKIQDLSTASQQNAPEYQYFQETYQSQKYLDYEDYVDEEEGPQADIIQHCRLQKIQLLESKVFDIDEKRTYEIYFPEYNSEIIISKLQKTHIIPILRSPMKNGRKTSKFRNTFNTPLVLGKKSGDYTSSQFTKMQQAPLKLYCNSNNL